ncbi:MAG: glycosyltransferase [Epsilonproteobacteria bacterium]|nr:glycosyltransferase [Campylobacterota bacterium]MBD3807594.1 glycosyltransferase [Campylobacterota bacterium]
MDKVTCLDHTFSTTKMLIQEKPTLENKPTDQFYSVLFLPECSERKGEGGLRTKGYFKRSFENKPLISIITVVFNGEKYLEQTIQSVINQNYDNVEYIIIDGGSTDKTLEIIKKYEDQIDYWVSEKDQGIYDAMNKGIRLVQGDLVGLINADDYYEQNSIESIVKAYQNEQFDVIYGDIYYLDGIQKKVATAYATGKRYRVFPYSFKWIWVDMLFPHPSSFVTSNTYKKYGLYDASFKISGDYDLFLRFYVQQARFFYLPEILASFREGGVSTTSMKLKRKENFQIRMKYSFLIAYAVSFFSTLVRLVKQI